MAFLIQTPCNENVLLFAPITTKIYESSWLAQKQNGNLLLCSLQKEFDLIKSYRAVDHRSRKLCTLFPANLVQSYNN